MSKKKTKIIKHLCDYCGGTEEKVDESYAGDLETAVMTITSHVVVPEFAEDIEREPDVRNICAACLIKTFDKVLEKQIKGALVKELTKEE